MDGYEALEARILAWAAAREDLLAGVVVGSRARMDGTADQWSDLDLILFTNSPQSYQQDSTWLGEFGELWAALLSHTGSGYPEWFALYAGGLKVDIVFVPVQPADRHELRRCWNGMHGQFSDLNGISGMKVASWQTGSIRGCCQICPAPSLRMTGLTSNGGWWRRWRCTVAWQMRWLLS